MDDLTFWFWLKLLLDEGVGLLAAATLPALLGAIIGIIVASVAYTGYRLLRIINSDTPRTARILTLLWLLLLLPLAFAFVGFQKGITKGVRNLVTEGSLSEDLVPQVGGEVATLVFELDNQLAFHLDQKPLPPEDALPRQELDTVLFLDRCDRGVDLVIEEFLPKAVADIKARSDFLAQGLGEKLLDWFAERFGEQLLRNQIEAAAEETGRGNPIGRWINGLPNAAAESNGNQLIGRSDLATYTIETALLAAIIDPFNYAAKLQAAFGLSVVIVVCLLPIAALLIFRAISKKPSPAE